MSRQLMPRRQPVPSAFEHRFLRGPAAGVVLRRGLAGGAVFDLGIGVHARDEQLAVPLDHLRDPQAFHDVDAGADDGHGRGLGVRGWGLGVGALLDRQRSTTTHATVDTMIAASTHHKPRGWRSLQRKYSRGDHGGFSVRNIATCGADFSRASCHCRRKSW